MRRDMSLGAGALSLVLGLCLAPQSSTAQVKTALAQVEPAREPVQAGMDGADRTLLEQGMSLEQAIALVIERSPAMDRANISLLLAELEALRARLDRLSASVDLSAGHQAGVGYQLGSDAEEADPFNNASSYGVAASARIPLFTGGASSAQVAKRALELERTSTEAEQLALDLSRAVYQAYVSVQSFDLRREAARESLERSHEALQIVQARLNSGLSAQIEVNRFQVDVLSQEQQLAELSQNAYNARQDLLNLVGLPGDRITLSQDLRAWNLHAWPGEPEPLVQQALGTNLNLRALRRGLEINDQDGTIARSAFLPQVYADLGASFGAQPSWINETTRELAEFAPAVGLSAGLSLNWNVFNLWQTRTHVARTDLARRDLDAQIADRMRSIARDVRKAHQVMRSLQERSPGVSRQLELARDNLNIIENLYAQGSATLLDLFDSQSSYRSALNQEATFRVQMALADLELRYLVGEPMK